jgi:CYTH domain-containing protein
MGLEIERKFTVKRLPEDLDKYPVHLIEQGYMSVVPAIRVRRDDDRYYMTYKSSKGFGQAGVDGTTGNRDSAEEIGKIEYNLPLDRQSYEHLVEKSDGNIISKKRYIIPLNEDAFSAEFMESHPEIRNIVGDLKIELDVFGGVFEGRILAEVEFPDEESAAAYHPADWFDMDVTGGVRYSNAHMSTEQLK